MINLKLEIGNEINIFDGKGSILKGEIINFSNGIYKIKIEDLIFQLSEHVLQKIIV